eukprot:scaffold23831_cov30-Tisochrysis_lutea.AAC.2
MEDACFSNEYPSELPPARSISFGTSLVGSITSHIAGDSQPRDPASEIVAVRALCDMRHRAISGFTVTFG